MSFVLSFRVINKQNKAEYLKIEQGIFLEYPVLKDLTLLKPAIGNFSGGGY
jgi:hypothetical protein